MAAGDRSDATALALLALDLHRQTDVHAVLDRVVAAAVERVPGARWAGVTVVDRSSTSTLAATAPVVTAVDSLQYALREGPCLSAATEPDVVISTDLQADPRWPTFGARAREHGVRSMLAVRLFSDRGVVGALNLYAPEVGAFGADSQSAAVPLAIHAGTAVTCVRADANVRLALDSRDVIGQAKGILMERLKLSADDAFALLTHVSQNRHRKLRDIAEHLASTGELVGLPPQTPPPAADPRDTPATG